MIPLFVILLSVGLIMIELRLYKIQKNTKACSDFLEYNGLILKALLDKKSE
jgi:hypothetical protein